MKKLLQSCMILAAGFLFLACPSSRPPTALPREAAHVAEQFVEAYYHLAHLDDALRLASGLAKAKIEEEKSLGGGTASKESTSGRQIHYRYREASQDPQEQNRYSVLLDLTIEIKPLPPMERLVRLTILQEPTSENKGAALAWKVANFVETIP